MVRYLARSISMTDTWWEEIVDALVDRPHMGIGVFPLVSEVDC